MVVNHPISPNNTWENVAKLEKSSKCHEFWTYLNILKVGNNRTARNTKQLNPLGDKEPHSRIQAWRWDRERRYYNRPSTYQVHTRKTNETNGSGGEAGDSIPHRFWFGRAFISSWKRWWCFCVLLGCDLEFLGPPATMNIAHGGILHGTAVASECECPSFSFNVPSIWNFLVKCWNSGPR